MTVLFAKPLLPETVREAIEQALERRAEREAKRIQVNVTPSGTVTLTGQVRSWAEKRATLAAARLRAGCPVGGGPPRDRSVEMNLPRRAPHRERTAGIDPAPGRVREDPVSMDFGKSGILDYGRELVSALQSAWS